MRIPVLSQIQDRRNAVSTDAPVAARKSIGSLLQTRNQMFLLVGGALLLTAVVWLLIVRPSTNRADSLRGQEKEQGVILEQMNKRIDQVSKVSQGASVAEQSYNKALDYDQLLPLDVDQALVLRDIPGMVAQASLQLKSLTPQEQSDEEAAVVSGATASRYNLVAAGSLDGITRLLALLADAKPLITVSSSTLSVVDPSRPSGNGSSTEVAPAPSVGGYELNLIIQVWSTKEPLLTLPKKEGEAATTGSSTTIPGTAPANTPASSSVPASTPANPSSTVPASSPTTTVPAPANP